MDGTTAQRLIYSGYSKVATKIGQNYAIYRFTGLINPIVAGNLIMTIPVTFAAEHKFVRNVKALNPVRICYADGRLLKPRDVLVGPYGTFFIGDMQPSLPIQIVRTNDVVSINRVGYTTAGSIKPITTPIAAGIPAHLQLKRIIVKAPTYGPKDTGTGVAEWLVYLPIPQGTLKQHDMLTTQDGMVYEIDAAEFSEIGYIVSARQAQA